MRQWFLIDENTGAVTGAVMSEKRPSGIREHLLIVPEEDMPEATLVQYRYWSERP